MTPPGFFNEVAAAARRRWEQLDADPGLKGPWRQLFAQVQSPRHVLSELLQNADDAGAKSASVRIVNNEFLFEHDGEDFTKEQFQSLCGFGFSNKRNLFTIGFRGVGFKSTFSLGKRVRIQSPTLDFAFDKERFTLPVWSEDGASTQKTRISVANVDKSRLLLLRKNLEAWATSPGSMLFFRNLEELVIESHTIRREVLARGPVSGSQRIRLTGTETAELLLIRSEEEAFPDEVVNEIREERNADDLHLPPCAVELVLGLEGDQRLFVVLPAGTDVGLPFSINGPFLQNPDRTAIKDPEASACNRWLLERAGRLAGEAMAAWLSKEHLSMESRAAAYRLLRDPVEDAADLGTSATKMVMDAMLGAVEDKPILLTTEGKLAEIGECTALPAELHEVWERKDLRAVFAKTAKHLISSSVGYEACAVLEAHGWVERVNNEGALQALGGRVAIPKPSSWVRLQSLWEWVKGEIGYDWRGVGRSLHIVPVEGQASLQPGKDVIRVSSRGQQLSEDDWSFISDFALAIDQGWLGHLSKLKSKLVEGEEHPALDLLETLGLHEPSQVDRIAAQASRRLLGRDSIPEEDLVRIAHIFAALDAAVPDDFRYATGAPEVQKVGDSVVFDANGEVEALVTKAWAEQRLLLPNYVQEFKSCTRDRWYEWAYSTKSKLHAFVPLTRQPKAVYGRKPFVEMVTSRGGEGPKEYRYKNDSFIIGDFDFPSEVLQHWKAKSDKNPKLWAAIVRGLLLDPLAGWEDALDVDVHQRSTQGTTSALSCGRLTPAWLMRLRSLACLTDTHGNPRTPPELMLRTPETESLLGIESFVAAELDDSPGKKKLLRLLGVRDTASGWEKVTERLRGLTRVKDVMRVLGDVLRLYEALDRISLRLSADELGKLRAVFAADALILSNTLDWFSSCEVSLHADPEDNSPVVHSTVHSLALWLRVGVPERPALEKSLEWLKTVAVGARLDGASYKRANLALARGGRRVWDELGHWLSLDQTWEPVRALKYRVSMRSLTRWEKLGVQTKRATADLRMLRGEGAEEAPFTVAPPLAQVITMQVTNVETIPGRSRRMGWLQPLAEGLSRVKLRDEAVTAKVRDVARRLLNTNWETVSRLEVTPYIDGTPAGEPLMPKVLWSGTKLYLVDLPTVRLMRELKEELTRPFGEAEIMEAVADCIDRDPEFVQEYLAANFELDAQAELPSVDEKGKGEKETPESGEREGEGEPEAEGETEPEGEAGEGDQPEEGEEEESLSDEETKPNKSSRPKELTFMDRYARARGFKWHEEERCYTHASGAWIGKAELPFNWLEHVNGDAAKRLFVVEESLAHGVEIPYELWRLMEINPDSIALVLCGEDGEPNEWSASHVQQLKATGQILVHQSRFILKQMAV